MASPTVDELAPRSEDEVREHLASGKLIEGLFELPAFLQELARING